MSKKLAPSIQIPKSIILLAKTLEIVSKKLTIKFLDKLFRTPVKFNRPEREKHFWESSKKSRVYINTINKEIDVLSYGYSKRKVLLVHGWSGRSTQLFMAANKLLENRYMVISFDAPAHGNSQGKQTNMLEFIEVCKQLSNEFGPFEAGIGHSLGGMTLYNTANTLKLNSFVTIGAGDTITEIIYDFVKNLKLKLKTAKRLKKYYDEFWKENLDNYSSSVQVKNIEIPLLIIHDELDGDVAVSCAKNIRQNSKNAHLHITKGLGHTKILRDEDTIDKAVTFIVKNQPL